MPSSNKKRSSKKSTVQTGQTYEAYAADFYTHHGFTILEKNYRFGHKEIDLIARKDTLIAFVEVKASRSDAFGHPAERVDRRKQDNLIAAAHQYLIQNNVTDCDIRFDLVTFYKGEMEHFPGAFTAGE